jgi:hypothetical protein
MSDNQTVQLFSVIPQTLEISLGQSIKLPTALGYNAPAGFLPGTLVAGRFRSGNNDELVAVGPTSGGTQLAVISIAIDPTTLTPTIAHTTMVPTGLNLLTLVGRAAPLTGIFGVRDQIILATRSR